MFVHIFIGIYLQLNHAQYRKIYNTIQYSTEANILYKINGWLQQVWSFYPRPLQERGSTDGHFLLLLFLLLFLLFFQPSNFLFLLGTENAMGGGGAWDFRCDAILFQPTLDQPYPHPNVWCAYFFTVYFFFYYCCQYNFPRLCQCVVQ